MKRFSILPQEMIAMLWHNRSLAHAFLKRDIMLRYRGSLMGVFWAFFQPLLMLVIYVFVFSLAFNSRWTINNDSKLEFALVLFLGLIVFNFFSECISRAPLLIVTHTNYVKKVIFPLEILPWISLGGCLFQAFMSFGVWLVAYVLLIGLPHQTIFLLPLVILPIILIALGLSWFLASIGVYLKDFHHIVNILITVLMFLSPIFYPVSAIPKPYQSILMLNPLTPVIEALRDILYWGQVPSMKYYGLYLLISLLCCYGGFVWFQKTRSGFADVL